jgi:hypothetical protein
MAIRVAVVCIANTIIIACAPDPRNPKTDQRPHEAARTASFGFHIIET